MKMTLTLKGERMGRWLSADQIQDLNVGTIPDDSVELVDEDGRRVSVPRDALITIYYFVRKLFMRDDIAYFLDDAEENGWQRVSGIPIPVLRAHMNEVLEEYEEEDGQHWTDELEDAIGHFARCHAELRDGRV